MIELQKICFIKGRDDASFEEARAFEYAYASDHGLFAHDIELVDALPAFVDLEVYPWEVENEHLYSHDRAMSCVSVDLKTGELCIDKDEMPVFAGFTRNEAGEITSIQSKEVWKVARTLSESELEQARECAIKIMQAENANMLKRREDNRLLMAGLVDCDPGDCE